MRFWILFKSCVLACLLWHSFGKGKGDIYYSVIARWGWKFRFSSWLQWILKGYVDAWHRFAEAWTPERGSLPKGGPVPVSTGDRNVLTTRGFQDVPLPRGQPFRETCSGLGDTRGGREGWVQIPVGAGLRGLTPWPMCISVVHIYWKNLHITVHSYLLYNHRHSTSLELFHLAELKLYTH